LISIITVVYNGEKYLEETILSVINQTYDNVEYVIIDGGSTDGTLDIIKKYEEKIDYWVSEKDCGIYDAMNKGIDLASGEWINFMNAGDSLVNNKVLNNLLSELSNFCNDIVYGDINIIRSFDLISIYYKICSKIDKYFLMENTICHQAIFFRKLLFLESGKHNLQYKIVGDYERLLTFFILGKKIKYSNILIANYLNDGFSTNNYYKSNIERLRVIKSKYGLSLRIILVHFKFILFGWLYQQKMKLIQLWKLR
jgi:glycosyltransferase involved in cell wall biosynthesis